MKKVGQIWKRENAVSFLIKILSIDDYTNAGSSCSCEVVNIDARDSEKFGREFVKGHVSHYFDIENRFKLYCTRYEEKS